MAPTTNTVKVKVMSRLKLSSGGCAVECSVSHTLINLWWPTTISKLTTTDFPKGFDFVE